MGLYLLFTGKKLFNNMCVTRFKIKVSATPRTEVIQSVESEACILLVLSLLLHIVTTLQFAKQKNQNLND